MAQFAHDEVLPFGEAEGSKKEQVARMFDRISGRYDLLNRVLSAGIDLRWRKKALLSLLPYQPQRILDVATGTGDVALMAQKLLQPAEIIGIDISRGMLEIGREKVTRAGLDGRVQLLQGDSETINFPDRSFDAVTVAFGVRNFEHLDQGLREIFRVLKPQGQLMILEFSKPKIPGIQQLYNLYMGMIAPNMAGMLKQDKRAYQYLNESARKFPEREAFTRILEQIGFTHTVCKPLSLGICCLYRAEKPA